jgi:hypothetical protein
MEFQNKRQFFRLLLPHPLSADVTIIKIKENAIETGNTRVLIEDISPGGLRFVSNIKLPVTHEVILEFRTDILAKTLYLPGYIVRKTDRAMGIYEYGVKFTLDDNDYATLSQLLNLLTIRLKRTPIVSGCRFATEEEMTRIRQNSLSS